MSKTEYYSSTNKETKAQNGSAMYPRPHSEPVKELGCDPGAQVQSRCFQPLPSPGFGPAVSNLLPGGAHEGEAGILFVFTFPALKHKSSTQEIFVE